MIQNNTSHEVQVNSQYAAVAAYNHSHKPDVTLASVDGHFLPSTVCSLQTASYSQSANGRLPSFAFHGIYGRKAIKFPVTTI